MIDAHLDDTTWEQLALGELDADARAERLRHIAACATCSRIWIGLRALETGARDIDPAIAATPAGLDDEIAPRRRRLGRAMVLGGIAIIAVAAIMLLWLRPRHSLDDDAPGSDVVRGDGVAPIAVQGHDRFAWTAVATATSYRITVFDSEGHVTWGPTEVKAPPVELPATLAAGSYRWRVEAIREGAVIARSSLVPLSVER